MKRLTATVFGHVQGVGFRYSTQRQASQLGLKGWVTNQRDGTVKVVAEGSEGELNKLSTWLDEGPRSARVERVDQSWSKATEELRTFSIR